MSNNIAYVIFDTIFPNPPVAQMAFFFIALSPDAGIVPVIGGGGSPSAVDVPYGTSVGQIRDLIKDKLQSSDFYDDPHLEVRFVS